VIIGTALEPVRSLAQIIEVLQSSRLAFNTASELIQSSKAVNTSKSKLLDDHPVLHLDQLCFKYSLYGENIHNKVSLRLTSNNTSPITVRLDGGTGSGKTTLLNLILGLLTPSEGKVLIKGIEVHSLPQLELNSLVQLVDRNPFILSDTVLNNTMLGSNASPEDFQQCLAALNLDGNPLFREQSHRFLTDASTISTGQGVMIALIRALLKKPQLLLLDEALTSLPEDTHLKILKGIRQLGINVLIVQHGTSTGLLAVPTIRIESLQGQGQ
jgi:ABC-type multidrug transport system fused ATPase/permease subunit